MSWKHLCTALAVPQWMRGKKSPSPAEGVRKPVFTEPPLHFPDDMCVCCSADRVLRRVVTPTHSIQVPSLEPKTPTDAANA